MPAMLQTAPETCNIFCTQCVSPAPVARLPWGQASASHEHMQPAALPHPGGTAPDAPPQHATAGDHTGLHCGAPALLLPRRSPLNAVIGGACRQTQQHMHQEQSQHLAEHTRLPGEEGVLLRPCPTCCTVHATAMTDCWQTIQDQQQLNTRPHSHVGHLATCAFCNKHV